jgi:hypothetical protein
MPNTTPPRNLTPVLRQRLQREMLKACQEVACPYGLVVEAFGSSPADYGRQFSTGRELFKITGIDPGRP